MWDVVAWNRAATVMLMDYGSPPPEKRSILRFILGQHAGVAQIPAHADNFEECVLRAIRSVLGTGAYAGFSKVSAARSTCRRSVWFT
jgi:hypothetical protein